MTCYKCGKETGNSNPECEPFCGSPPQPKWLIDYNQITEPQDAINLVTALRDSGVRLTIEEGSPAYELCKKFLRPNEN